MNIETANRLVNLRKQAGLSQEALAEKIGVSRQAVSKWERAEASPDTDNLILLADLYGVCLDELLRGKSDATTAREEAACDDAAASDTQAKEQVSFLNGIHVRDKDGTKVDVSLRGIHVEDAGEGTQVHIDKNGVFVEEASGAKHIFPPDKPKSVWMKFPYALLVLLVFFLLGTFCNLWWIAWLLFLTIPLYYTLIDAIVKRDANHFAYPVLVVVVYLWLGMAWGLWHPWWSLFFTIPFYYGIVALFKKSE